MHKRLRIYFFYTVLPFAMSMLGAAFFYQGILHTLKGNPHPQINYAIFIVTIVGGILIIFSALRILKEGKKLDEFNTALRSGMERTELQELAINYDADIAYVLRMIAAVFGRRINQQEQIALEHELVKAKTRLDGRIALPQYLSGLLVGLGLLGTFIGLLATLDDIAELIASFTTLDISTANPIDVFRNMVDRMKAPMKSMGIAFSASLFGLLGSIILGFMMVSIKRCSQELMSLLGSEVAQHIEDALSKEGFVYSCGAMQQAQIPTSNLHPMYASVPPRPMRPGMNLAETELGTNADSENAVSADKGIGGEAGNGGASSLGGAERFTSGSSGSGLLPRNENTMEEVRILRRIENLLGENSRLQTQELQMQLDNFNKQRGEVMKTMAEHSETVIQFRSELQRIGRQLGQLQAILDKGSIDMVGLLNDRFSDLTQATGRQVNVMATVADLMNRMADDSVETRQIMTELALRSSPQEQRAMLFDVINIMRNQEPRES